MSPEAALCGVDGCDRPSARGGLCWAHEKRKRYGKPVVVTLPPADQSPLERLLGLALRVAAAEEMPEFERALDALRKGSLAYALKLGWHAPGKCPRAR